MMSLRCFKVGVLLKPPQGLSVDLLGSLKGGFLWAMSSTPLSQYFSTPK